MIVPLPTPLPYPTVLMYANVLHRGGASGSLDLSLSKVGGIRHIPILVIMLFSLICSLLRPFLSSRIIRQLIAYVKIYRQSGRMMHRMKLICKVDV